MAGFLAIAASERFDVQVRAWQRALAGVRRRHDTGGGENVPLTVEVREHGHGGVAVWRRTAGEFPASGRFTEAGVGWVGQCLDDDGDASARVARTLLEPGGPAEAELARSNGVFAAVVLADDGRRLTVATDRHGLQPVFVLRAERATIASTDAMALLPWLAHPRLDLAALDLLLRCGEVIGDRTMIEGVEQLGAAAVLIAVHSGASPMGGATAAPRRHANTGANANASRDPAPPPANGGGAVQRFVRQYWRIGHRPDDRASFARLAGELAELLRTAVRRVERACPRLGVPLSGGLDSRLLLGLCNEPSRVPSFTWGQPGCRDLRYAAVFARAVGSPHHPRQFRPEEWPALWPLAVALTGGTYGLRDIFVLPYVPLMAQHCDVVLNGLNGDSILGGNVARREWRHAPDKAALGEITWRWRVSPVEEAAADALLHGGAPSRGARDAWIGSITAMPANQPVLAFNDWFYENRVRRWTNAATALLRHRVESQAPFFDRDFVDRVLAAPIAWKSRHRLYLAVLRRACPVASRVRWQKTGLPPAAGFLPNLLSMAAHKAVRVVTARTGLRRRSGVDVADPAAWLRGPWRAAAEQVLLQDTHGVPWAPEAAARAWRDHLAGRDLSRLLLNLVNARLLQRALAE